VELEQDCEQKIKIKGEKKEIIIGANEVIQDKSEEKEEIIELEQDQEAVIQIEPK
jgi:hypothetical protein